MDPYLEDPAIWPEFHLVFCCNLEWLLNETIVPKYYADLEVMNEYREGVTTPWRRVNIIERKTRCVVTVMEIPTIEDKEPGSVGQGNYRKRCKETLRAEKNLVEFDLLRVGESSFPRGHSHGCEYRVHISRSNGRPNASMWPVRVQDTLPVIPIPLNDGEPDSPLELQQAVARVYDRAAFDLKIDYTQEPVPPLPPDLAKWANKLLKQKKLR